jgi:hypothetical protein
VAAFEYDELVLNFLIHHNHPKEGWLKAEDAESSEKVGEAVTRGLRLMAELL